VQWGTTLKTQCGQQVCFSKSLRHVEARAPASVLRTITSPAIAVEDEEWSHCENAPFRSLGATKAENRKGKPYAPQSLRKLRAYRNPFVAPKFCSVYAAHAIAVRNG
jgi:hypothetical protein